MRTRGVEFALAAALAAFPLTGCGALAPADDGTPAAAPTAAETGEAEQESRAAKLEILNARMKVAKLEHSSQGMNAESSLMLAEAELQLAQAQLEQFRELDMPNRITRSELSLQRARDSAMESAEELAQIEIMYKEQDLEDLTAEFVINRGKRNAERSKASLAVQEREHVSLTKHTLPRELHNLKLAVVRKENALRSAKISAETGRLQKEIAIMNLKRELAELEKGTPR